MRQDQSHRDQQEHFSEKRNAKRDLRLAKPQKGALDTALDAENRHSAQIDRQNLFYQGDEFLICGKQSGKDAGTEHGKDHIQKGCQEGDGDHPANGHFYTVKGTCTEVVADDGLHSCGKAVDRYKNQL